jgi:hypothetical protein
MTPEQEILDTLIEILEDNDCLKDSFFYGPMQEKSRIKEECTLAITRILLERKSLHPKQ